MNHTADTGFVDETGSDKRALRRYRIHALKGKQTVSDTEV